MAIRKAEKRKAKLRLALLGPTGSGKTFSALKLAFGLGETKIGLIDTERGSGDLYADLGDYDIIQLTPPYTVQKYRDAIREFEDAGYGVIIVDSLSHAWAGEGGLLEKQGSIAKSSGNSYTAWGQITPEQQRLVDQILGSPAHVIVTVRVKMAYVLERNDKGREVPRKVGLQPVFREGIEYEFTVCMDIDTDHVATASKDRTNLFNGWSDQITPKTGKMLLDWLNSGAEPPAPPPRKKTIKEWLEDLHRDLTLVTNDEEFDAISQRPDVINAFKGFGDAPREELSHIFAETTQRLLDEKEIGAANEPEEV